MSRRALWLAIGRGRRAPAPALEPTPTDVAMMREALSLGSAGAAMGEVPVGAVVYLTQTGEVLSRAHNRREVDRSPSAHAEHLAIELACRRRGDWRLNDCTLVVTLEPCAMCAGLIVNARVGRLVFGASDPKAGAAGSLMRLTEDARLNHRVAPVRGVLGEDCAAMLRDFFRSLRRERRGG